MFWKLRYVLEFQPEIGLHQQIEVYGVMMKLEP